MQARTSGLGHQIFLDMPGGADLRRKLHFPLESHSLRLVVFSLLMRGINLELQFCHFLLEHLELRSAEQYCVS
jgi:hypothetical protein